MEPNNHYTTLVNFSLFSPETKISYEMLFIYLIILTPWHLSFSHFVLMTQMNLYIFNWVFIFTHVNAHTQDSELVLAHILCASLIYA